MAGNLIAFRQATVNTFRSPRPDSAALGLPWLCCCLGLGCKELLCRSIACPLELVLLYALHQRGTFRKRLSPSAFLLARGPWIGLPGL